MHSSTIYTTAQWILPYGYGLLFLALIVEGPVVTAAGAFLAALNYFDIWAVFALSLLGNIVPDIIYYAIGYWTRGEVIDKYGHYFRITKERVKHLEELAKEHAWKALTVIKLVPFLATPGLIAVGSARMPARKYIWISIVLTIPTSLFFLIIGYYFGAIYDTIIRYVDYGGYSLIIFLGIFFGISLLWKNSVKKLAERIEKE